MGDSESKKSEKPKNSAWQDRTAQALRDNLRRRKAPDSSDGGKDSANSKS